MDDHQPVMVTPDTFKLKGLWTERGFWAAVMVSLPGIVAVYAESARSIMAAEPLDAGMVYSILAASPLALYLAARQVPRGAAISAAGLVAASMETDQMAFPDFPPDDLQGE
jgi:hypothetical protein